MVIPRVRIVLVLACVHIVFMTLGASRAIGSWDGTGAYMTRVSTDAKGSQIVGANFSPTISADGRYAAFISDASNLVPGNSDGTFDFFRKDLLTGEVVLISAEPPGIQHNQWWVETTISADGRYIAFTSDASNIISGDTNKVSDIYRKDLLTGQVLRVSTNSSGDQANGFSHVPVISADGHYIAFMSAASNLVADDTNGVNDIFIKDMESGKTINVSTNSTGTEANGFSEFPAISADGRYVVFSSVASNLATQDTNGSTDIFRKDVVTGQVLMASTASDGSHGNDGSTRPAISADGRYVAFYSRAASLVGDSASGTSFMLSQVFRKDMITGELALVSTDSNGNRGNDSSMDVAISSDGRYVAFVSAASNLGGGDGYKGNDIFRKDMVTGQVLRVSINVSGIPSDHGCNEPPAISSDGRFVAFGSYGENLVSGDSNKAEDIFVADVAHHPNSNGTVVGRVLNYKGKALRRVAVRIDNTVIPTDKNGWYKFTKVAPGHYWLYIDAPGMRGQMQRIFVNGGTVRANDAYLGRAKSNKIEAGIIKGRVQNKAGKALRGYTVKIGDTTVKTDNKGKFQFRNIYTDWPGIYYVEYLGGGYLDQVQIVKIENGYDLVLPTAILDKH